MKLVRTEEGAENLLPRKKYLAKIGVKRGQVVSAGLVHGKNVVRVGARQVGKIIPETDCLVTSQKGVFLSVTVADCLPIYFFDPQKEAVGLVHAGWRGLAVGIISEIVSEFKKKFKSDPGNILAVVGPGISPRHYEVGDEVAFKFSHYPKAIKEKGGRKYLDLRNVVRAQLAEAGLPGENREIHDGCTYSDSQKYFSYRRDKSENAGVMLAVIGIKE